MKNQMIHTGAGILDSATSDDERLLGEIGRRLEAVMDQAPSDAVARIVVKKICGKKIRGGFYAFLRICSKQKKFLATASAPRLMDAINQMFENGSQQIKGWKAVRIVSSPEWPDFA